MCVAKSRTQADDPDPLVDRLPGHEAVREQRAVPGDDAQQTTPSHPELGERAGPGPQQRGRIGVLVLPGLIGTRSPTAS
jgi:hypothetical protein